MSKKLYLNSSKAKAITEYRTRGRMKVTIKFTQEEAQALKNWTSQVKPPQLDEDTFYKQVFFNGVGALNHQLSEMAKQSLKDENVRKQLVEQGVDIEKLERELYSTQAQSPADPTPVVPEMPTDQDLADNGIYEVKDSAQTTTDSKN